MGNELVTGGNAQDVATKAEKVWLKQQAVNWGSQPTSGHVFSFGGGMKGQLGTAELVDELLPQDIGGGVDSAEALAKKEREELKRREKEARKDGRLKQAAARAVTRSEGGGEGGDGGNSGGEDGGEKEGKGNFHSSSSYAPPVSPQNVNVGAAWGRAKKLVQVKYDKPQNHFEHPVVAVEAGDGWSLALTTDGQVYSWGTGKIGELGLGVKAGTKDDIRDVRATATRIEKLYKPGHRIVCISAYSQHALAVSEKGICFSWGDGRFGQLGHNSWENEIRPRPINVLKEETVVMAAAGKFHSLALSSHGKVFSWGRGVSGQLGHGARKSLNFPKPIDALAPRHRDDSEAGDGSKVSVTKVVAVAAGGKHSLAIFGDGDLFSWGCGVDGQLGHGDLRQLRGSDGELASENGDLTLPVALDFFGPLSPDSDVDDGEDTEEELLSPEMEQIRDLFDELDADGSGTLDKSEVAQLSKKLGEKLTGPFGLGRGKLNRAFADMDNDGSGVVTFEEFAAWWELNHPPEDMSVEERVRQLFDHIDEDGSGELDKGEVGLLAAKMGEKMTSFLGGSKKLDEAFAEMDPNGDGTVTFEEFLFWYKHTSWTPPG